MEWWTVEYNNNDVIDLITDFKFSIQDRTNYDIWKEKPSEIKLQVRTK